MPTSRNVDFALECGRLLSSNLDVGEVLRQIVRLSARLVGAKTASLLLYDEARRDLYFDVAIGLGPEASALRFPVGTGIAGIVAARKKPVLLHDARKSRFWSPAVDRRSGFATRSILAVPAVAGGRLIGVIEAINKRQGRFTKADLKALLALAAQAAVAIENARLFSEVTEEKSKLSLVFSEMEDGAVLSDRAGAILLANGAALKLTQGTNGAARTVSQLFHGFNLTPALEAILSNPDPEMLEFRAERAKPKELVLSGKVLQLDRASKARSSRSRTGWLFVFKDATETARENRLKRAFLSLISHKLRTPLTTVVGYTELLAEELTEPGNDRAVAGETRRKAINSLVTQSRKLSSLVNKLILYTALDNPESRIADETFPLERAAEEAVEEIGAWLAQRGVELRSSLPGSTWVRGDPSHLREVVKNLLENAAKFDSRPKKPVELSVSSEGELARLSVRDTGPGIPPEDRDRIFERFYQAEESFTGQIEGWGLGLAFSRKVAEMHGGRLDLQSVIGKGTSVDIFLPSAPAP